MKKRLLIIVLTLVMITSLFIGIGITASAAGRIIDITQEANLTVTNKIANIYYVQGLREYHEQRDANNWTKFFGQWAWVLSEQDARAKLNELMRSPSSMDSQPSTLSVNSPNNEPANFRLNGEKADTLLIWAKAQPMSVNEGGYYYALLPMPKEITFTTNLNSSYSISSVDSKTLTVEATCADYDGEPTYQWYYCGTTSRKDSATPIDGATGKSCTVKPATAKESHYYFCRVTAGEVVGDSVVAGVYASDPYVYINNTDKLYETCYAVTGKPYTMGITNTSNNVASGELCYQWYRCTDSEGNGAEAIEGATTDSFDVPTGTKGTYYYFGKAYIKLNGSEICSARTQVAKVIVRDAHKITPVGTPGEDGYTIVEFGKFYFTGYSLQDDLTCPTNETCKLTYEPDDGYTVDKILVYKTGEPETTVDLEEWDSDTKQFTMPDFDITVEVTFKKLESIEKVDLTVDWSRVPSVNVGDNVLNVRFNEYYDWAVFADGVGAVNGPVGMTIFTVKVTDNNKKEICDAIVASGFDGLTPDDLTDMLEMLGCGAWLHPEFLFGINGYVVKENDELAIMPFVYPYSGYFPVVGDAMFGAYNGVVTCNGEPVSNSAVFGDASMSMLFPFIEVGTVSDLAAKKNAAKTEVSDVFYYDELGYTTGGSYGVMPGIAAEGETITIRVTPEEGYEVDTVTWQPFIMASDEGDDINVVTLVDGKYTFTMPAQSVMVKVTFKKIAAPHEHEYTYTSNNNGTHNGTCECGEDAIVNEACTYGNDEVCDLCGYDSHEHEYTYTSNNNGTHNGTCECGEDAITNEACTYGNDEVCDLCGYDSHEHEYTYTSSNNGTHNGTCECGEDAITNEACTYGNDEVCDLCGYDSHEHEYTYTSNNNGTHNGACECGEDAIVNEACTYGNDEVCDLCGYDSHEHEYTYTSNNNGTHNGACACGEDAITNEACTYGNDEVCDLCGYDSHEHEYTYTSNNNGTHNGTCECGEDAIVNEACTYGNDEVCDLCGYDSHEHEYTYTSSNNGTHNGACACGEDAITNEACAYVGGQCDKCGYAEPATSPTVNVPVSNGDNKVDVEAEISGNDATIKPLDEERINELIGPENTSGDVVIDLSKLGESIDTAGIPKATLEAIVNAAEDANNNTEHLVIKLSTAELKLDDTAMRAIVDQANGDVIKFNFDDVGLGRLNETQKDAIKGMDVRKGYEAYITVNDQRIGDFNGGEVEIIVPYAVPEGEDIASFSVWYIDDDGTLEKQQSTYDGKEKCFIVNHFSDYVIVYSAEDAPTTEGDGMWIVWVILIILIILICVITYYIYKKRKSRKNEA